VSPTATFSEAMNPATLTTSTFTLVQQGQSTPVAATVSYAGQVATLDPTAFRWENIHRAVDELLDGIVAR